MPYDFHIRLIRSGRKTMALEISAPDCVTVRAPRLMPRFAIDAFIAKHRPWIEDRLQQAAARQAAQSGTPPLAPEDIRLLTAQAAAFLPQRAARLAPLVGVSYGKITIRCQKTRWGSCSAQGNLSFNCLLMLCPPFVQDYVVVHELCHRREMNHSPRFWAEVGRVLPDYASARQWLKKEGPALMDRLKS